MRLDETIRILNDADVEFVIIGGVAMGLQGSAHLTRDIDSCYAERRGHTVASVSEIMS